MGSELYIHWGRKEKKDGKKKLPILTDRISPPFRPQRHESFHPPEGSQQGVVGVVSPIAAAHFFELTST